MLEQKDVEDKVNKLEQEVKAQMNQLDMINANLVKLNEAKNQLISNIQLVRGALEAYKDCAGIKPEAQPQPEVTE